MKGLSKGRYDETFASEDGKRYALSVELINSLRVIFPCKMLSAFHLLHLPKFTSN